MFHDPRVVENSKSFVMIRMNKDQNTELSKKYAPDGEYIPRTFFLAPDGTLNEAITEERPNYKYFYNTSDPSSLRRGMDAALAAYSATKPAALRRRACRSRGRSGFSPVSINRRWYLDFRLLPAPAPRG